MTIRTVLPTFRHTCIGYSRASAVVGRRTCRLVTTHSAAAAAAIWHAPARDVCAWTLDWDLSYLKATCGYLVGIQSERSADKFNWQVWHVRSSVCTVQKLTRVWTSVVISLHCRFFSAILTAALWNCSSISLNFLYVFLMCLSVIITANCSWLFTCNQAMHNIIITFHYLGIGGGTWAHCWPPFVCLSARGRDNSRSYDWIFMKLDKYVDYGWLTDNFYRLTLC